VTDSDVKDYRLREYSKVPNFGVQGSAVLKSGFAEKTCCGQF
jgi:hypothetical protein